jgi:hypothetical protein
VGTPSDPLPPAGQRCPSARALTRPFPWPDDTTHGPSILETRKASPHSDGQRRWTSGCTALRRDPRLSSRPGAATTGGRLVRRPRARRSCGSRRLDSSAGGRRALLMRALHSPDFLRAQARAGGLWSGSSPACQRQNIAANCDCAAASGGDRSPHGHFESSSGPVHLRGSGVLFDYSLEAGCLQLAELTTSVLSYWPSAGL